MIRRCLALFVVGFLAWLVRDHASSDPGGAGMRAAFMLGFILLSSHLVGGIGERLGLPRITGYILTGILFGPYAVGLIGSEIREDLNIFEQMAYAFIGLAAGSELRLEALRKRARSVFSLILCTMVLVFVGVACATWAVHSRLPFVSDPSFFQVLGLCTLFGVIATARSPSSAIAIIRETQSRGPFTETLLGVTMAVDLLLLPLFYVALAMLKMSFGEGAGSGWRPLLILMAELLASILAGLFVGWLLSLYLRYRGPKLPLVLLGLCFFVYKLAVLAEAYVHEAHGIALHLEPLLICAAAGFACANLSPHGRGLSHSMDNVGLPVYVVFFTLAGAVLDMGAVGESLFVAGFLAVARGMAMWGGAGIAHRFAGDPPSFRRYGWMGFVTQAGLSIALAVQLGEVFPVWGGAVGSVLIAGIALNQIAGPVLFQRALDGVGESRRARKAAAAARRER